ncbi:MAG: 23S rRNA (uracil(1939)-C(5))-methyltransferase RlmD [Clostridiaceae bacterium]|nr:23S rRNA (uracil(1939)-C(5))-methyltransferase RlmD [Clostridiaceae bacterium]
MELKKNDRINLKIDSCSADGSGIGRYNGMAIFVPAAAVGDEITAHILKVKKNYAFAKIENILVPSADRIKPECPVYLKCGGCAFSHINYEAEKKIKAEHVVECLHRIGGVFPELEEIIGGNDCRYRNKAQFPVALENGEMRAGFYSPHSHRVVHCPDCLLQPPEFEGILDVFARYVRENGVSVYDETAHTGLLRHIYLRKGSASGEIMVCAVVNGNYLPAEEKLVDALLEKESTIKSIILNTNTKKTNVILGDRCRTLWGSDYITDILCSLKFRISPLSFYQVNRDQAERLYNKAAEYAGLTGSETVLDLYCGAGTIGLSMASKAKEIIGVEIVPQAVEDAKINAAENGITNARFICGDASQAAALLREQGIRPDVIILDPPRKGCGEDLLKTAAQMEPQRIVYVSCDPATLARDCAALKTLGYEAIKAAPVDMFPRTGHVETVCLLSKLNTKQHIEIELNLDELDLTDVEKKATYEEIKAYVLENTGLKVSNLYIAQIKQKYGIIERENYNKPKSKNARQPMCPLEKEKAIWEALKYFGMI